MAAKAFDVDLTIDVDLTLDVDFTFDVDLNIPQIFKSTVSRGRQQQSTLNEKSLKESKWI